MKQKERNRKDPNTEQVRGEQQTSIRRIFVRVGRDGVSVSVLVSVRRKVGVSLINGTSAVSSPERILARVAPND